MQAQDVAHEVKVEVKTDTQGIHNKRGSFKYFGSIFQENGDIGNVSYHIGEG